MLNTKDLSLIIILAVVGFVITLLVAQTATLLTGIPGANYSLTIVLAIVTGFSLLIYEGRRWRFFAQTVLFAILIMPTRLGGGPFNIGKMSIAINALLCDMIFNSVYESFNKRNRLLMWAIIATVEFWIMNPFISGYLIKPLFFSPEYITKFIEVALLLLPVIIIESIAGGYIGYKIYRRLKESPLNIQRTNK